ncbi:MAG: hybrid sensor histidine kinase/response regulator [Paucibacter sp.]|nr:hybrid sensor histidine kinase/response regulator [Roseateles sp.]
MMIETSAAAAAESTPAAQGPEPDYVREELLRLLCGYGGRAPVMSCLSVVIIAGMVADAVSPLLWVPWVAFVFTVLCMRWVVLGRMQHLKQVPLNKRLSWAYWLSGLNGFGIAAALLFTPLITDNEHMVLTILMLGLCAGGVPVTAGQRVLIRLLVMPILVATALSWLLVQWPHVGTIQLGLAAMVMAYGLIVRTVARDTYRIFVDSVEIRAQQVRSNAQLRVALRQAEEAAQARTRFIAAASHDLRQPMHTLSLLAAAMLRRPLDATSAEIARNMDIAVQTLAMQLDALLDISKLDSQAVQVTQQVLRLAPWLARLVHQFQPVAVSKGLTLTLACPPDACIETDPLLFERVVRNLVDNAIKYTERGGVLVRVEREEALWRVSVADTGIGIPDEEQARVFEEFYQLDNPERDRSKGVGLGLSIVSRLVDLLDLTLKLDSTPGRGSTFSLGIAAVDTATAPGVGALHGDIDLPSMHVLLIEDDEQVAQAMRTLLVAHGCEVSLAGGTREALVKCMTRRPDIVLSDLRLRGSDDGLAAIHSLRLAVPGLPAVLITGDTVPERLVAVYASGIPLLHKPVPEVQLLDAIRTALRSAVTKPSLA